MAKYYIHEIPEGYEARIEGNKVIIELAESEDERIINAIIGILKNSNAIDINVSQEKMFAWLEKQKENPKSADSIPADCTSDVKCENSWHKVADSLPDNPREVLCKDEAGNFFIGRYYVGEGWEISNYDDEDKLHDLNPPVSKWIDFPSEKQKERGPLTKEEEYILHRIIEYLEDEVCPSEWISLLHDIYCLPYEKQKEQNKCPEFCSGHCVGCERKEQKPVKHPKMVEMLREHLENTPKEQLDVEFEELKNWNDVGPTVEEFFHGKPIEWNEKDEKMRACAISLLQISRDSGMAINPGFGKPVRAINKCIDWLKSLPLNLKKKNEDVTKLCSNKWSEEDEKHINNILDIIDYWKATTHFVSYQGGTIDADINWLKSLRSQPKPEWSEEDKRIIDTIVSVLGQYIDYKSVSGTGSDYATPRYTKEIDWLKSLCPSWKPSEEQIKQLQRAINCYESNWGEDKVLHSLINDLKELKGGCCSYEGN